MKTIKHTAELAREFWELTKRYKLREIAQKFWGEGGDASYVHKVLREYNYPSIHYNRRCDYTYLSEGERGYIAGILDGEGCVDAYSSLFSITNTNKDMLDWLLDRLGGHVRKRKGHTPNHNDIWIFRLGKAEALSFFEVILPYLIIKRAKVQNALTIFTQPKIPNIE